jgi:hypothetical protein
MTSQSPCIPIFATEAQSFRLNENKMYNSLLHEYFSLHVHHIMTISTGFLSYIRCFAELSVINCVFTKYELEMKHSPVLVQACCHVFIVRVLRRLVIPPHHRRRRRRNHPQGLGLLLACLKSIRVFPAISSSASKQHSVLSACS